MLVGGRRHDHNEKIKLEKENSNDVCLEEVSLRHYMSPYEAMFGAPLRNVLADSSLPLRAIPNLCHEEDLEKLVNIQDQTEPEISNNSDEDEVDSINNLVEREDETPSGSSSEECPCTKSETMCKICERKIKISEARTACHGIGYGIVAKFCSCIQARQKKMLPL
ncbi:hypothetical protein QE152_g26693 [Popillia japonica]|uniref:Uncharacterized protein n=1 Tax=Popillia japonica TaxID=7064 RepID=A0AAW1JXF5_POPJA